MALQADKIERNLTEVSIGRDQHHEQYEIVETQLINTAMASGSIDTLRDEQGNVLLYESPTDPNSNELSYRQYIDFSVAQKRYDVTEVLNAIDYEIVEISRTFSETELLDQFFSNYNKLQDLIPAFGENRSLESMINQKDTASFVASEDFESVQTELTELQTTFGGIDSTNASLLVENVSLKSQIDSLQRIIDQLNGVQNDTTL